MEFRIEVTTQLVDRNGYGVDLTQEELEELSGEIEGILERNFNRTPWATESHNEVLLCSTEITRGKE